VVATDSTSREVGGATTSCVQGSSVALVYQAVPGVGAIHAQALSNRQGRAAGAILLDQDYSAEEALRYITSQNFDRYASYRQYGIATFQQAVGFTGASTGSYAGDIQGETGPYRYAIQGNLLTSGRVLQQSELAFATVGCDLADKLMLALEAGALNGEGDQRCRPNAPADAAFIQVDKADGTVHLSLDVKGSRNPLGELRQKFNQWRRLNPCNS